MPSRLLRVLSIATLLAMIFGASVSLPAAVGAAAPAATRIPAALTVPPPPGVIDLATYPATRWIVQLDAPPLAENQASLNQSSPTQGGNRLNLAAPSSQSYLAQLQAQQQAFITNQLSQVAPGAQVQRDYQVVLDGLAVKMTQDQAAAVRALSGVRAVTPDVPIQPDTYASAIGIGAPTLWAQEGGQANAGSGVKVAIIDAGLYVTHTVSGYTGNICFGDAGYPDYPLGFPKGDTRFTNKKVIVAKAYFRPDDPPAPGADTPIPGNGESTHGTHTAGTVSCDVITTSPISGEPPITWSGIAPKAWLMNYKIFYNSQSTQDFQNGNGYVAEIVQAIEDAVKDGADITSNSWGASYQNTLGWPDPMVEAAEAATDAGVTMVFAASNAGPDLATISSPAISPKVIAVGAVTKNMGFVSGSLDVTGPAPVPANLANIGALVQSNAASNGFVNAPQPAGIGPARLVLASAVSSDHTMYGCNVSGVSPFATDALTKTVVLMEKKATSDCTNDERIYNAQQAGAVGVIVYNAPGTGASADTLTTMTGSTSGTSKRALVTIPAWFVVRSDGLALGSWATSNPSTAQVRYTANTHVSHVAGDVMASFSSRGPAQGGYLKPDVDAPGSSVYSSGLCNPYPPTCFGSASGTSMATPHVAGAAALLKALHPSWTPQQIKSALMSTAFEDVWLNSAQTSPATLLDRGAGRIDLTKAGNPGLSFDPASISEPNLIAGQTVPFSFQARDLTGLGRSWTLSASVSMAGVVTDTVALNVPATVAPGKDGTVTVQGTVTVSPDGLPGDFDGVIRFTSPNGLTALHVPVWVRVIDPAPTADVLLVDMDGSSHSGSTFANYSTYYTATLNALGVSYTYVDMVNSTSPFSTTQQLFGYKTVWVFSGDNSGSSSTYRLLSLANQDRISEWLDSGGQLLTSGQHFAAASDVNTSYGSPSIGRSRLYNGYLGVAGAGTAYAATIPGPPAGVGVNAMAGLDVDLRPGFDGAGNQMNIDVSRPMSDTDTYGGQSLVRPFFQLVTLTAPGNAISFGRTSDPVLEEERQQILYRTINFGFGLEGINSTTGYATLDQVARRALDFLADKITLTVPAAAAQAGQATMFTASAVSSAGADITQYRWDFGDGTPIVTTTGATSSVQHTYGIVGPVTYRAEATDSLGHTTVVHSSASFSVGVAASAVTVTSPANPALFGQPVVLTATTEAESPAVALVPSGTATFYDGGSPIASCQNVPLDADGKATCTLPSPSVGTHDITVTYSGDSNFNGSNSPVYQQVVNDVAIQGLQAGNGGPVVVHQPATFIGTITAGTNVLYSWDFGDGQSSSAATSPSATHAYAHAGTYVATLSAVNNQGMLTAQTTIEVHLQAELYLPLIQKN